MNLLTELKRRNVFRIAALYVVGSWLLLQAGELFFEMLELPDWSLRLVFGLLALGFPIALIFSWVYELTPEGIKLEKDVDRSSSITPDTGKRLDLMTMALVAVGIAVVLVDRLVMPDGTENGVSENGVSVNFQGTSATQPTPEGKIDTDPISRSIAVLPFADLSAEGDQAYFTDGISEELLNLLAQVDGLKVAARTSSFAFKGSDRSIPEIGRRLKVATVLEGSVRKAGDQVRITAQLIDVDEGFHLWSNSYDRRLDNIFEVQDEIASAIVDALRIELDLAEKPESSTRNVEAFDLYLRGRQYSRDPSREGLLRAIDFYNQAIAVDPGFARAFAGIADAYVWLEDYGGFRAEEVYPRAEEAAQMAIALDPDLAEAQAAVGFILENYHGDKYGAAAAYERALEINPNFIGIYKSYPGLLSDLGEVRRQYELYRQGAEIDPLSSYLKARQALTLGLLEGHDKGMALLDAMLAESPEDTYAIEEKANLLREQRRFAEAITLYARNHELRPGDPYAASQIAQIAVKLNDLDRARKWIAKARSYGPDNRWEMIGLAELYEATGDWQSFDGLYPVEGPIGGARYAGWADLVLGREEIARAEFERALERRGFKPETITVLDVEPILGLALLDRRAGRDPAGERLAAVIGMLDRLEAQGTLGGGDLYTPLARARIAALSGDREQALGHLMVASQGRFAEPWFLDQDPFFEAWRDDPEFQAIVRGMLEHAALELEKLRRLED